MDTDIHKILSAVPGVFFENRRGLWLRPNISIRGTAMIDHQKLLSWKMVS